VLSCRKKLGSISQIINHARDNDDQEENVSGSPIAKSTMDDGTRVNEYKSAVTAGEGVELPRKLTAYRSSASKLSKRVSHTTSLPCEARIMVDYNKLKHLSSDKKDRTECVVVELCETKQASAFNPKPGDQGVFFSVHSSAKQTTESFYDILDPQTSCLCCKHTVASLKQNWIPFQPGAM
jgi:hypothetical protein